MNFENIELSKKKIREKYNKNKYIQIKMLRLLVLLSLLACNQYDVSAVTLDATLLAQLGFNNQSSYVNVDENNITDIDPNAFKGYTRLTFLTMKSNAFSKLDLSAFKDLVNLQLLSLGSNPLLTQLTNSKKIIFQFLEELDCYNNPLTSLDSNVINGLPNIVSFYAINDYQLSPLKPNQLSSWKKLANLFITTKNQTSLTKEHLNGLSSLRSLQFRYSNIKTVEVHTFVTFSNLTYIGLEGNDITAFEYLQIPNNLKSLTLGGNKMNYFMLSRTMGVIEQLFLNNNLFRSFKSMDFTFLTNLTDLSLGSNPHAYQNEIAGHMIPLVNLKTIEIRNLSIQTIDSNLFKKNTKLEKIYLGYNKISVVPYNTFSHLKNLSLLELSINQISVLDNRTFIGLNNLELLYLSTNKFTKIAPRTFYNLSNLSGLSLFNNLISEIDSLAFTECQKLRYIDLSYNQLSKLSPGTFQNLNLEYLKLNRNQISEIDNSTFEGIKSLVNLDLSSNTISNISPRTFKSVNITSLYLSYNWLTKLDNDTFAGQNQLAYIDLRFNRINLIEAGAFNGLTNLQNIYLDYNNLTQLDNSIFAGCNNLQGIYLSNNPNLIKNNLQSLCPTNAVNCKVYF